MTKPWLLRTTRFVSSAVLTLLAALALPASGAEHLPLEVGNRWELRSQNVPNPMVFEVTGRTRDGYTVRWDNPWVKAQFEFQDEGNRILLVGLDMGQGVARMPSDTVYFDFGAQKGKRWQNSVGRLEVQDTNRTINTPAGKFENCVVIRATDDKGSATTWGFAPGTGFVQFGEGRGGFYLTSFTRSGGNPISRSAEPSRRAEERRSQGRSSGPSASASVNTPGHGTLLIGLDSNPPPSEGYTPDSMRKRFDMAVRGGVTLQYLHPKWNEIEPKSGKFNFDDVDFKTGLAVAHNLPLAVNLRIIDTNNRAVPDPYKGWAWDDKRMVDRLTQTLNALAPRFKGRVRLISIGNEVDAYFGSKKGEVAAYTRLIEAVLPRVRELFPGAQFSINFTPGAVPHLNGYLRPLLDLSDVLSMTYYPLNADFTMRDPGSARSDFAQFLNVANGKKLFLQEIGYPSGGENKSSENAQAAFLSAVFRELAARRSSILAANFVWMSDLPIPVVEDLTRYYRAGNSAAFKSYLATLGMFDREGRPKPAWSVFQSEAGRLR